MPQETNLNVSPYFDDFNEDKNFNRVLFKPASPIQARELTQLQTILQNQIEKFGQHFFKEGSQVIPGQIAYDPLYYAVELADTFFGIDVSVYIDKLVGKTIRGESSGVEAKVVNYITSTDSDRGTNTLYVKYSKSGNDFVTNTFEDGENLICSTDIEYGNSRIIANNPFAACIPTGATSIGCAASIQEGVYFIRGFFVKVQAGTVILDQYNATPTVRVGLFISENLVTAYSDDTLFDNAADFNNFAAPGADRLQIRTTLIKKDIDEFNDENFVELMRLENGKLEKFVKKTDYNLIRDELARRTYDESGDYYVKPFQMSVKESLNNRQGNGGVYLPVQKTASGNAPSQDLMVYNVSPGKAYVKGYDIEKISTTLVDVEKPRETKTVSSGAIAFDSVSNVKINNVYGSPVVGFGTTATVSLRSQRVSTNGTAAGIEIGVAKVYDYKLEAAAYSNTASKYEVFLYDLQTFTTITVSSDVTLSTPVHVKGARSGATGFLKNNISSSKSLTLTDTTGTFMVDEPLIVNGISETYVVTSVREYSFGDAKSVQQQVGINTFTADLELTSRFNVAPSGTNFTIATDGTVTVPGERFAAGIRTGDIFSYNITGFSTATFNRVSSISSDGSTITLAAVTDRNGVCDGSLPGSEIQTSDFTLLRPQIINGRDSKLVTRLPEPFISSVDLSSASIQIRKQYSLSISSNRGSVVIEDPDLFFQPFDEERYNLVFSDGTVEALTSAKVDFNSTFKSVTLRGLSKASDTNAILVTTLKKINVKSKSKNLTRCSKTVIDRSKYEYSGSTGTSFNNGLTYNAVFGTRVEDEQICLNIPDALRVHAVFESSTKSAPIIPSITLVNRSSDLTNTIQGELVIGSSSGAVARVVSRTATKTDIVYKNELRFSVGESVVFQNSGITGDVSIVVIGDKNILTDFTFDNGQRKEFYDYSRIIRNGGAPEPQRQLAIIYDHYIVDTGAGGDLVTVNSYSPESYETDLTTFFGSPSSDIIDVRPRVKNYNPTSDTDSPFEYDFRDFSQSGSGVPNILIPEETLTLGYSYYLGRIDKLLLSKDGFFELKKGASSENPVAPETPSGGFLVATIFHKPYVRSAQRDSKVILSKHKRYTMFDIARLENRVQNIEFYTQLSLLETDTANLNIKDATTGLDRFKSGFFVDNFRSHGSHNIANPLFRASIHKAKGELRPSHYTTGIDLLLGSSQIVGIGTTANPNADLTQVSDLQSNSLRKTGDVVSLNYTEKAFIKQNFATATENVNPFAVINWVGIVGLNPSSDVWVDEKNLEVNDIQFEGSYETFMSQLAIDPNTGLSPIDWGSWEEDWNSVDTTTREIDRESLGTEVTGGGGWRRGFTPGGQQLPTAHAGKVSRTRSIDMRETFDVTSEIDIDISRGLSRTGVQFQVNERTDTQSIGTRLISREIIPYIRSRNVEFISNRIKPRTQFYAFFDGEDVTQYVTPKLLEISMSQGVFQVGETVVGKMEGARDNSGSTPEITFRVAQTNHKTGSYDSPTLVYDLNPYSDSVGLSSSYSATSSVLNIDTASLQLQVLGTFNGYAAKNMKLTGQTSGAEATVNDMRLITDEKGSLIGSFFIPDINSSITAPQFETGTRTFRLTSSQVNSLSPVDNPSTAETVYRAEGNLDTFQEDILSVRNADVQRESFSDTTVTSQTVTRTIQTQDFEDRTVTQNQWYDPLAQSFEIVEDNGVFVTSIDVFFQSKDTSIPVTCQIRTMQTGLPTNTIVPFGEVVYEPSQINLSDDGTVATKFVFPSPVYLSGKNEYSIVLLSASNDYKVFIAVMEQEDITTAGLPESERTIVSQQPYMGSLFKSQNGSTWTPAQFEDLKFNMYKAQFVQTPGTLKLYNPELGVGNLSHAKLRPNPLEFLTQEINVAFGATVTTRDFSVGSRLSQVSNRDAEGNVVKTLGAIKINTSATEAGGITTNSVGTGLTPSASNFTFTGVALTSITGNGSGAVANIQVTSGGIGIVTVTSGGSGYAVGDVLGCDLGETGRNTRFNVGIVSATNSVILDKVQGTFNTSSELMTINAAGIASALTGSQPDSVSNTEFWRDGLHVKVFHRNHGMHARNNKVTISGSIGVTTTTTVSTQYSNTATTDIDVASVGVFASFENVGVSTTNPGYAKIGDEVIAYTGVNAGSTPQKLTGITRSIDNTVSQTHRVGDIVEKYEASGISLRRINKTHSFADVSTSVPVELDHYYVKVDTTSSGVGTVRDGTNSFAPLKISDSQKLGGNKVKATQNVQFESITPNVQFLAPRDTNLSTRIRTVSGTSVDGSETSFQDQGFETISIGGENRLSSPRIIASKVNEDDKLTTLPGNKSLTMELVLSTQDVNVSPIIDIDRISVITTTNRLDRPVTNFADDDRVNSIFEDPNSAIYVSKRVNLENPASFLQVKLAGYRDETADIRVMYRLFRVDGIDAEQPYELFPGYNNLTDTTGDGFGDRVIDPKNNNGRPDKLVPPSRYDGEFKDYQFTANNLPEFNGFEIKIIMTGTNQAYPPRIKDLRAIAFA
mgnify:CR=1 FL=1